MYGYIYLTTNLVNGMQYIGKHKSDKFDENYKGSGKLLLKAIKKYGIENFFTELIEECFSLDELNRREKFYIYFCDADSDKNYYNIRSGGDGGFGSGENHPWYGRKMTQEHLRKKSENTRGENNPFYGKHHTEEARKRISEKMSKQFTGDGNPCYRKVGINNGAINKYVNRDTLNNYLSNGWNLGGIRPNKKKKEV